jgi:ribosomal protein S25
MIPFFTSTPVCAQNTDTVDPITSTGIASIRNNNVFGARNDALADAQKKALVKAAVRLMTFEQFSRQFTELKRTLFTKTADYIESYRVLYDSTLGDRYHITIQVTVAMEALKNNLLNTRSISSQLKLPRILLMVSQQKLDQNFSTCWWSFIDPEKELTTIDSTVRNELQKRGFEVIDHTSMIKKITTSKVYGCLDILPEDVQALGKQFQVDIVVVGKAQVELTGETENPSQKIVQANIVAKALRVDDGSVIATSESYIPATDDSEITAQQIALEKSASRLAHTIGEKLSLLWVKENRGIASSTLSVSGLSDYLDFSRFKSALKKAIPEIYNLLQKTLSDTGALIEVESPLDTSSLAALIERKQFKDFTVYIASVTPSLIEMEVMLKNQEPEEELE